MTNSLTRRILGTVLFIGALLFSLASLSWSALSQTQPHVPRPYLVADINPGPDPSYPDYLTAGSKTLYAFASDPDQRGVWATDGSEEGTRFLAEIYPDAPNEYYVPGYPTPVAESGAPVAVGDNLFFVNNSDSQGDELWQSDGSPTGTMLIHDTLSGTLMAPGYYVGNLTPFNEQELIFRGSDAEHGVELWFSDSTITNTHIISDIVPGAFGSWPSGLIQVGNYVYFQVRNEAYEVSLWRTDGTAVGTEHLVDLPGRIYRWMEDPLTYVNGLFFLAVDHPDYGFEYWRSDGTDVGTWPLKDIAPGTTGSIGYGQGDHIGFNTNFYFAAYDRGVYGEELWKSDGSEENTILLKDINPGANSSVPLWLEVANNLLFFTANDGVHGRELWITDGTEIGTNMVLDINPTGDGIQTGYGVDFYLPKYASLNALYFFAANDGVHGTELWQSDGTVAGTVMVMDINPGSTGSEPRGFTVLGNTLYFTADDGVHGREIWALSHDAIAEDDTIITRMGQSATSLFLENDNYLDPGQLQIAIASQPQHGSVALNNFAFLYTPELGYIGPDSFTYTLSDGVGAPEAAAVTIDVQGTRLFLPYIVKFNLVDLPD